MSGKCLVAFDFDQTIIDDNSDVYVCRLAPGGVIPPEIKETYSKEGWTVYMRNVFKYLHKNGITEADILTCMEEIPLAPGMNELLHYLNSDKYEVVIISDSNSVFIHHIMKVAGLHEHINAVYTNPANFDTLGCLNIEMYHVQDYCKLSTINLCKGQILNSHIEKRSSQGITFSSVAYVGDGQNDLCPSLRLSENDLVFARKGYRLEKAICASEELKIKAKIVLWTSADEIKDCLMETR